ncbi:MAG: electron transfer flavoprotein subunit alpha/FixB family protein [Euryarchaeota archaeon]|jgi:electron transfer flavoprotein alpha subunit|nr:electron transfer flavoprotein subunit alpha/FixB family protein [Euryarchaeota archaeon]
MDITIIAETQGNGLHAVTNQLVGAASSLGASPTVLCGGGVGADEAAGIAGVGKVLSVTGDCFSTFDGGAWAAAFDAAAGSGVIVGAATAQGRDVVARIAARRGIPVVQDVVSMSPGLNMTHPIYSGKAMQEVTVSGDCGVTLRANTFAPAGGGGSAETATVQQSGDVKIAVQEAIAKASERLDVADADIIISGGRGMGGPENFDKLYALADEMGGAVGASRAAVDAWDGIPHTMQVGQTGKTVNPSLYIAVGISGAIQHLAGMRTSKYIVAINKDPEAPIFKVADYGIVATWEEAMPVLAAEIAKIL